MLSLDIEVLTVGGLASLLTASLAAVLFRAIRIANRSGRADPATLRRIALMRASLGVLCLSGAVMVTLIIAIAVRMLGTAPLSPAVTRVLADAFLWTYVVWLPAALFALPVTGRWGRRAVRSFPPLRRGEAVSRLLWSGARRSRPARSIRSAAAKYDRKLW